MTDAVSREHICALENENTSTLATANNEASLTYTMRPWTNQIIVEEAKFPTAHNFILFGNKTKHIVQFSLFSIHSTRSSPTFPATKFRYGKKFVLGLFDKSE